MTAAQLTHLAELAAYASGFYATTNPAAARLFEDTALRADRLSAELGREEQQARQTVELAAEVEVPDPVSL
jgi:hypothetical protein